MGYRRVAKVMERAHRRLDARRSERFEQRLPESLRPIHGAALRMREDALSVPLEGRAAAVLPQLLGERRRDRERPHAVLRLRVPHPGYTVDEVDVGPSQRLKLRATEPEQDEGEERHPSLLVRECLRDPGHLDGLEDPPPSPGSFGRSAFAAGLASTSSSRTWIPGEATRARPAKSSIAARRRRIVRVLLLLSFSA